MNIERRAKNTRTDSGEAGFSGRDEVVHAENRLSPGPAGQRNQATLRHPERSTYRCFLTDLAGFIDICRAGPNYADRQDRMKIGPFCVRLYPRDGCYCTPLLVICQAPLRQIFADQEVVFFPGIRRDQAWIGHDRGCQGGGTSARESGTRRRNMLRHLLQDTLRIADIGCQIANDHLDRHRLLGLMPAIIIGCTGQS